MLLGSPIKKPTAIQLQAMQLTESIQLLSALGLAHFWAKAPFFQVAPADHWTYQAGMGSYGPTNSA